MSRKRTAEPAGPVRVGDRVTRHPLTILAPSESMFGRNAKDLQGRVVYVHPRGRYHVVLFDGGIRECFPGVGR